MLQSRHVSVSCEGEQVVFRNGNVAFTLDFQVALELALAMKVEARYAKMAAGVEGFAWRVFGVLTDLNAPAPKRRRFAPALPERLKARQIAVHQVGQLVNVKIGSIEMGFPFREAGKVAQWIRVRGKEARNNARELAHWSKLVPANSILLPERRV